jgi:tetratricopeptide (TPR) repeat protein
MSSTKRAAAAEAFQVGLRRHQSGMLDQAERAYQQALAALPDHDDALHMMGLLAHQTGRSDMALDRLKRAVALKPSAPHYHNSLGTVLYDKGRPREALASFRKALRLQPAVAPLHRNLGRALADLGRFAEAEESFRAALAIDPTFREAVNDLGALLLRLGRAQEALNCIETAMALLRPDAALYTNAGLALQALDRLDEAATSFRAALRFAPDYAAAWINLGNVLQDKEDGPAAIEALERGAALAPNSVEALGNLGVALFRQRRFEEAASAYRRALVLAPDSADLQCNLSAMLLTLGEYEAGWRGFEARWRTPGMAPFWPKTSAAVWDGSVDPAGKTILLFAEQGHGDTMQFVRYAPLLAARGSTVLLLVQPALKSLLARMPGVAACYGFGEAVPRADLICPMMSLPLAFGTRLDAVPADIPYLSPPNDAEAAWRRRLEGLPGLKIGLCWAGDPRPGDRACHRTDRRRSIALEQLAPLAGIGGASFVSLQKGAGAAQATDPPPGMALHDWTGELASFADTAALVQALDLVISVDTAVAHLAGALGRPVWVLSRFDSCWRWLDGRDDSPWYPTLRLFRQTAPGDWAGVIARTGDALADWARMRRRGARADA